MPFLFSTQHQKPETYEKLECEQRDNISKQCHGNLHRIKITLGEDAVGDPARFWSPNNNGY